MLNKVKSLSILDTIMFVLSFTFIGGILLGVSLYNDTTRSFITEDSLANYVIDENYQRVSSNIEQFREKNNSQEIEEYIALGDYYYNATLYKAYIEVDDLKEASKYKDNMEECAKGVGSLYNHINNIDEQLEIK